MVSDRKKVTLDVAVNTDEGRIEALEKQLESAKKKASELKQQKLQVQIDTDTQKLEETRSKIEELKQQQAQLTVGVDDAKIDELQAEIEELDGKAISLEANIEKGKVDALQEQLDNMNGKTVTVNTATDSSGLDGISNKLVGIAGTIGMVDQATQMWEASTARQSQQFYLSANLGADAAAKMQKEIQGIVSQVPGDDTFMNQLMTTALAQNTKMTTDELRTMANVAADYMAGSKMMGKMNLESQQDIYKYLLDGNTAELERGSILSSQVDKLKDQATIQDRIKAINEALKAMGYAGISGYDTAANNLEEFQGRLEKARADWGDVFLPLEQGALKAAMALDDQYGGALAMAITGTQTLIPTVVSGVSAFGEFHRGIEALKETRIGDWASSAKDRFNNLRDSIRNIGSSERFSTIKNGLINIATKAKEAALSIGTTLKEALVGAAKAAKEAAVWIAQTSKELLISAANAMKSAAAWVWEKAVKVASTIATKAMTAAQWLLNIAMSANPVTLIVIAIVALIAILWYLYNTCEPVRNAIDAIWAGVSEAIQPIVEGVQWLIDKLTQLANGDWTVTIEIAKAGASAGIEGIFDVANNDLSRGLFEAIAGEEALAQADEGMPILKEKLTSGINEMLDSIWNDGAQGFLGWLANIAGIDVGSYLTGLQTSFNQIPQWVNQAGTGAIQGFQNMFNGVSNWLNSTIGNVISFGSRLVSNMGNSARNAVSQFTSGISRLGNALRDELNGMLSDAANFVGEIGRIMWNAAVNAWNNFLNGLQRHSPGIMMREFKAEMLGIVDTAEDTKSPLGDTMYSLARTAVSSWGNPDLGYNLSNGDLTVKNVDGNTDVIGLLSRILEALVNQRAAGNVTFNHYGDTDDEDKMYRILEFIQRAVDWDNETAGRKVGGA